MNFTAKFYKSKMSDTTITTLNFRNHLAFHEARLLRGAINTILDGRVNPELNNHVNNDSLYYGYPAIQYKSINGNAALVAMGDTFNLLGEIVKKGSSPATLGYKECLLEVMNVEQERYQPLVDGVPKFYRIVKYLPFTNEAYNNYRKTLALTDRVCMIESMIVSNMLLFFKAIGYVCVDRLVCNIVRVEDVSWERYKNIKFRCFDLQFVTNALLPNNIGLGKSTSIGFGTLQRLSQSEFDQFDFGNLGD